MTYVKALALFSGGLDSILATRLIMEQGVEVEAIQFVTPFFHYDLLDDIEGHVERMHNKYGIKVILEDISPGYLQLLHNPAHGFGKNFNPCIDCKILMFSRAKEMLAERGASFLISGEVLGQRPMSQRRDTLNVIERDSGTRSLLLRPLCAQLLKETLPELQGWVDRSKLLRFSGRGRSDQIAMAARYGITDFPAPAGGCTLADPILGRRIEKLYSTDSRLQGAEITAVDIRLLLVGRQFILPGGGWLILGRDEKENNTLEKLAGEDDALLLMEDWPGPTAVLRKIASHSVSDVDVREVLNLAAAMVVHYGRKLPVGKTSGEVTCTFGGNRILLRAAPAVDESYRNWGIL
ncbi:MAG: thiamine biosynthesis protein [Proteobacteria bacterium]|nr:thiamine biosynthesis protein [Pseudomonadota bacterium]